MDENNNGPVPGIIGQEIPSEPATSSINNIKKEDNRIFDSSSFTGGESESLVLNGDQANAGQKKAKGQNIFTKWQFWAITSGVILAASAIAIIVIMGVYEGKVASANAVAGYDATISELEKEKTNFDEAFLELANSAFGVSSKSTMTIYASDEQLSEAKKSCLGRFSISEGDINYIDTLKTGSELLENGKNVAEEKEHLVSIVSGYTSANSAIETCRENILEPIKNQFEITFGDITTKETTSAYGTEYIEFYQEINIKYKGDKAITRIEFEYDLVDRNGVEVASREASYSSYNNGGKEIKSGDEFTADLYKSFSSQYRVMKSEYKDEMLKYKPVLKTINGLYSYK